MSTHIPGPRKATMLAEDAATGTASGAATGPGAPGTPTAIAARSARVASGARRRLMGSRGRGGDGPGLTVGARTARGKTRFGRISPDSGVDYSAATADSASPGGSPRGFRNAK